MDLSQYIADGVVDSTLVKQPGSIDGQQFVIQNCKNSRIFLLDHIGTVTVDDCVGCSIIIGPTRLAFKNVGCTSLFLIEIIICHCFFILFILLIF